MKHSLMTILVTLFIMSLFSSCANVAGNYPPLKENQIIATQQTYPDEIFVSANFKISSGKWFNADSFEKAMAQKVSDKPDHIKELFYSVLPDARPMAIQMCKEIKEQKASFYSLNFWINPKVNINFQIGGLTLTLQDNQGNTVKVKDQGCLFVYYEGMNSKLYDSAKQTVQFNRGFNKRPGYKKSANIIYVRLKPQYYNWKVIALDINSQKIYTQ